MAENAASPPLDRLSARLRSRATKLSPKLRKAAAFFDENRGDVLELSALEIGGLIGVSDATVVRAARALGFSGLTELKKAIAGTLGAAPTHVRNLQRALASVDQDVDGAIDLVLDHEAQLIANLAEGEARRAIPVAVDLLHKAQRVVVFGTGTSGLIAAYAVRMLARHGKPVLLLDATGFDLAEQMLTLREGDAVLMLFFGRAYPEVEVLMEEARNRGLPMVVVTESAEKPILKAASAVLEIRRSGPDGAPLHGATLVCLEAIIMGVAAMEQQASLDSLERLQLLRARIVQRRTSGRRARRDR
ncbi:MurR/RpiR family transcriptional regulator [Devosia sp. LjRoot3]|uniref:MurR/RpiR family transcriptional regulator n=1 Tax=Devosia sp. LjRoot3 TaxID=3342319 RepID=UPI003ED03757